MVFNNDDDIEVLEMDEMPTRSKKYEKDEEKKPKKKSKIKKRVKRKSTPVNKKMFMFQTAFCAISLLFILGCCVFYGSRLIKYYRIYNPKPTGGTTVKLLSNEIASRSEIVYEGSGLYINGGVYTYKGEVSNNYLKYNNMLWRIVKVNQDGTMDIILDDYINVLNWGSGDYSKANIQNYLNEEFLKNLDKSMLSPFNVCTDKFDKLTDFACNDKLSDKYISLLDVSNFLNSVIEGKSYLVKNKEIFWLNNQGTEKVWHTNGGNVSMSDGSSFYEVRPMVTLKATICLYGGDGSKENPYLVEKEKKLDVGSYVKLGDDLWTIYSVDGGFKLSLNENLSKQYHFSYKKDSYDLSDENSLAEYLNTTYLDSLSYKDLIIESEWASGKYEKDYKEIFSEKVKAKVGLLNMADLKFNNDIDNYLLMNANSDGLIYTYGEVLKIGKSTTYRNVRPCITIKKNVKIESGNGSSNDPYILEV